MAKLTLLEYILIASMSITILIAGYLTFNRIVYGIQYVCYDAWIFGMNLALLLQIHDNHCNTNRG
jgi:hypothetical protein